MVRAGARKRQSGAWENEDVPDALGIYVSIPFCRAKCTFCNFASEAFPPGRMQGYVQRVLEEIAAAPITARVVGGELPSSVDTVYFGGGTPSLLEPAHLQELMHALRSQFQIAQDAEITMEAAPGQIPEALLDALLQCGVNRVSLGVQSFVDREAKAVGRLHSGAACRAEIARLQAAGVPRLSVDLIAGLPHQTAHSWAESLRQVVDSGVEHASVYMLETDGESRLGTEVERLRAESQLTVLGQQARYHADAAPSEEQCAALYAQACEVLTANGFAQYEISNFARPRAQSLHNRRYWDRRPYLGFGLDAHSMLRNGEGSVRFRNTDAFETYLQNIAPEEVTGIDALAAFEECVFLGLRRAEGVAFEELEHWGRTELLQALRQRALELAEDGLLTVDAERMALTARGRVLSSGVFGELLTVSV